MCCIKITRLISVIFISYPMIVDFTMFFHKKSLSLDMSRLDKCRQVSLALCAGLELLSDVLCLPGSQAALAKHGLAEAPSEVQAVNLWHQAERS